jgi:hypothetical protein
MANTMPSNAEIFFVHLQQVFGNQVAIHRAAEPGKEPPVSVFIYKHFPRKGMITGVTYGLSLFPFPGWKFSRPEMIVSVRSLDPAWPCAAAVFATNFRGERPFKSGDVFTTDHPLAPDTSMTGFLVFAQSVLPDEHATVQLNDYKVHLSQFYPIYGQEVPLYQRIGLEEFWKHKQFDKFNVARKPIRNS